MFISQPTLVNIYPAPPVIMDIGIQVDMFLAASSPKQLSATTPVAATAFSFTDEDET